MDNSFFDIMTTPRDVESAKKLLTRKARSRRVKPKVFHSTTYPNNRIYLELECTGTF